MNEGLSIDHGVDPTPEVQATPVSRRGRPRSTPRQAIQREPIHDPARGAVATGRNGEILTRTRRDATGDPLHIDKSIIPDGWEYQWNTTDVYGSTENTRVTSNIMYANGWRPVPAERHPGMFMPHGHVGPIVAAGCRLEERPKVLCDESRAEDYGKARAQMSDRDQSLMGRKANLRGAMNNGFEMGGRYRGTGGDLKMSIDPALDAPAPQYQPADDSIA